MDLVKTAEEFNESLGLSLTEAQVGAIRAMREDLFRRWGETPETLVLEF
jgi:phage tail sheath protein FI